MGDDVIENLVNRMHNRVFDVIRNNGDPINYKCPIIIIAFVGGLTFKTNKKFQKRPVLARDEAFFWKE